VAPISSFIPESVIMPIASLLVANSTGVSGDVTANPTMISENMITPIATLLGPIIAGVLGFFVESTKRESKKTERSKWISGCLSKNEVMKDCLEEGRKINDYFYKGSSIKLNILIIGSWVLMSLSMLFLVWYLEPQVFFVKVLGFFGLSFVASLYNESILSTGVYFCILHAFLFNSFAYIEVILRYFQKFLKTKSDFKDLSYMTKRINCQLLYFYLIVATAYIIASSWNLWIHDFSLTGILFFFLFYVVVLFIDINRVAKLRNQFKSYLNGYLLQKYQGDFPTVYIQTKYNTLFGKAYDVFDDKILILKNHGQIISTEWEQIVSMKCEV
jgi:hypothetical protein